MGRVEFNQSEAGIERRAGRVGKALDKTRQFVQPSARGIGYPSANRIGLGPRSAELIRPSGGTAVASG